MTTLNKLTPLKADQLKEILQDKESREKSWDKENELLLITSMMAHIGSPDRELRDTLIYGAFCELILEKQLDQQLLREILISCLSDNMLFKELGEVGTDSVFTRSFTSLLIALILHVDNDEHFLSQELLLKVKDQLVSYIKSENDLRGLVAGKGWAHSIAHVADAFDELVKNKNITEGYFFEIVSALWNKVLVSDYVYIHEEEERILIPLLEMLNQGLKPEVMQGFLENIPHELEKQKELITEEKYWYLHANCKKFLNSFYVKIDNLGDLSLLQKSIGNCILKI